MIENQSRRFAIKYTGSRNPLVIRIPLMPVAIATKSTENRLLTIDACSFKLQTIPVSNRFPLCPPRKSDVVKVIFNNGFGVYNQQGKRTKILQYMDSRVVAQTPTTVSKVWNLVGSPDAFVWSNGHDLEIGFTNVNDEQIDFALLNCEYVLTLEVQVQ